MAFLRSIGASIALLAAGALVTACGGDSEGGGPGAAVVDTVRARAEDVPQLVQAVGTVEADNQTTVAAEVRGQVSKIVRDEGSRVAAGAAVIQLDPGNYRYEAEQAQANLEKARTQLALDESLLERYDKLLAAGAIDQQTYDDLKAKVASERATVGQTTAALGTARHDLGKTTIRAPFAGTVGKRHVQLGQYVAADDPIFDLVDASPVRVRFSVPETYVGVVDEGDPVRFRVRSDTVSARVAQVDYVSPKIDPGTRTFEVTASYQNADLSVRPGAFADVSLTTDIHRGAAVVPEEALVTEGTQNYVYVVRDSTVSKRPVTVGSRFDGMVEIASGVEPGVSVVNVGQQGLPDGARVRVSTGARPETLQRE